MQYSTIFRYLFLGIFNGFVVYLVPLTIAFESWFLLIITIIITLLVNLTYATNRLKPLKWITPGMIFLLSFVVFPAANDNSLWSKIENILVDNKIDYVVPSFDEITIKRSAEVITS